MNLLLEHWFRRTIPADIRWLKEHGFTASSEGGFEHDIPRVNGTVYVYRSESQAFGWQASATWYKDDKRKSFESQSYGNATEALAEVVERLEYEIGHTEYWSRRELEA